MHELINSTWREALAEEFTKDYFATLTSEVKTAYLEAEPIYPPYLDIFKALDLTPLPAVKVVILGQDPYHSEGQAHGLAFSVPDGVRIPPSLTNIYKEIAADTGTQPSPSGNLERWATQGVLLLNSTLTVKAHNAGSHQKLGWELFTDACIAAVSEHTEHTVFMLWGNWAAHKADLIDTSTHCILHAPHPSPLSAYRGFFGCKHFSAANNYLLEHGQTPIKW